LQTIEKDNPDTKRVVHLSLGTPALEKKIDRACVEKSRWQ